MPKKETIMHVEDDEDWGATVKRVLNREGYKVVFFTSLDDAQRHYTAHSSSISAIVCDGTIDESDDGRRWAAELHAAGKPVMVLSGNAPDGIPSLSKGQFLDGERFVEIIKALLDRQATV